MNEQSPEYLLHKLVLELDKVADSLLRQEVGLSYKRFYFLLVLRHKGTVTQHELAVALGYSDPAVSNMVQPLANAGYLAIEPSAHHGRKRLITLSTQGLSLAVKGGQLLSAHFGTFMKQSGVDSAVYAGDTQRLLRVVQQYTS